MVFNPYTREQLRWLLDGDSITEQFRADIEAALKDGSVEAIESLGEFANEVWSSANHQSRPQVCEPVDQSGSQGSSGA